MPLTAADWPEHLPPASQPPGRSGGASAIRVNADAGRLEAVPPADPGHLMTSEEWARVQADAEAAEEGPLWIQQLPDGRLGLAGEGDHAG